MKVTANHISAARIVLAVLLAFTKPLSGVFFFIYILCGISDALDGYIARKTNTAGRLGEKLDSIGDFAVIVILLVKLYPVVHPTFPILVWVVIIFIIRIASVCTAFLKYRTLGMLHTYFNKLTGFLLFAFPFLLAANQSNIPVYLICAAASVASAEELFIMLFSKQYDANRKSILSRAKSS